MNEPANKFLLEVEEVYCAECIYVTGHVHTGQYWTCVICGNQQGKKRKFITRLKDSINFSIFKRKIE